MSPAPASSGRHGRTSGAAPARAFGPRPARSAVSIACTQASTSSGWRMIPPSLTASEMPPRDEPIVGTPWSDHPGEGVLDLGGHEQQVVRGVDRAHGGGAGDTVDIRVGGELAGRVPPALDEGEPEGGQPADQLMQEGRTLGGEGIDHQHAAGDAAGCAAAPRRGGARHLLGTTRPGPGPRCLRSSRPRRGPSLSVAFYTRGELHGLTGITHYRLGEAEKAEFHAHRCIAASATTSTATAPTTSPRRPSRRSRRAT